MDQQPLEGCPIMPIMTQRDLAEKLKVSQATVSMALQNDPRISPKVRGRILKEAEALGYTPDPTLRALSLRRRLKTQGQYRATIAVIGGWTSPAEISKHPLYDFYWKGIQERAKELGYQIDYFYWNANQPSPRIHQVLNARGIRGVLILPFLQSTSLDMVNWSKLSVVAFGYSVVSPTFHRITHNHYQSLYSALKGIENRQFKRIGLTNRQDRRLLYLWNGAYLSYLEESNAKKLPVFLHPTAFEEKPFLKWYKENRPDLILAYDGESIRKCLLKHRVKMPKDVSLLSYSIRSDQTELTGIQENPFETGKSGVNALDQQLIHYHFGIPEFPKITLVSGTWQEGKSIRPLKNKE